MRNIYFHFAGHRGFSLRGAPWFFTSRDTLVLLNTIWETLIYCNIRPIEYWWPV